MADMAPWMASRTMGSVVLRRQNRPTSPDLPLAYTGLKACVCSRRSLPALKGRPDLEALCSQSDGRTVSDCPLYVATVEPSSARLTAICVSVAFIVTTPLCACLPVCEIYQP